MHIIFEIPVIVKLLGVFALIVLLIRVKQPLGTAFLSGAIALGLWSQMSVLQIASSIGTSVIQAKTLLLTLMIVLILILSHSLERFGQMQRLLAAFQGLLRNAKLNLVMFPALIGLLPMPGGAIFSAPMVQELGKEYALKPEVKSLINYWFRHVWEYSWPLYPGPLLAASLASISIWRFCGLSVPVTLAAIVAGDVFLLYQLTQQQSDGIPTETTAAQRITFFKEMAPILSVIVGALVGSMLVSGVHQFTGLRTEIPQEVPLIAALIMSIGWVWRSHRASGSQIVGILKNKALLTMIYMIMAIYGFKAILEDSHAIIDVSAFLADQQIPLLLVIIVLPALVGLISGISVAFVGTTFPIVISLLATLSIEGTAMLPYLMLAFASGFMGVMLSPLHICLILTREFFQTDFGKVYPYLWKLSLTTLIGAMCYFGLLLLVAF